MKRCIRCILPDVFPNISFNSDGICNYCLKNEKMVNVEKLINEQKKSILEKVEEAKSLNKKYDALLCLSGGKDSTYTLIQAKEVFGLNILAFTLDNNYLSNKAYDNIRSIVENVGVDHLFFKPAKEDANELFRLSVQKDIFPKSSNKRISNICYTCITMVNTYAFNLAVDQEIPLIIAGFNLGQIPMNSIVYRYDTKLISEFRDQTFNPLFEKTTRNQKERLFTFTDKEPNPLPWYLNPMAIEKISESDIIQSIKNYGWQMPADTDGCSTNCRLNKLAIYAHQKQYQYSPYALELAMAIHEGTMDRETALEKLENLGNEEELHEIALDLKLGHLL
jgi:tRNA(Ile)-lysidine synthase TilS/MesJ